MSCGVIDNAASHLIRFNLFKPILTFKFVGATGCEISMESSRLLAPLLQINIPLSKMTTNDVEPVLLSILEKGSVLNFNEYINTVNYDVVLRTKLIEGDTPTLQCDSWVAKFSAVTNSHWIVKNTSPYAVRVLYKKSYTCKNKKCNAKINIIFKKNNRNTRKNDPLLAQGLTAVIKIIFKHNHEVYCPALGLSSSAKIDSKYNTNSYKYNTNIPSPELIKCESRIDDSIQDYSMDSPQNSDDNDTDDDCKDDATIEALKLINIPMDGSDSQVETGRFKNELQRISNIVEDTKTVEMTKYLKGLNGILETINTPQQFCEKFSKILE